MFLDNTDDYLVFISSERNKYSVIIFIRHCDAEKPRAVKQIANTVRYTKVSGKHFNPTLFTETDKASR